MRRLLRGAAVTVPAAAITAARRAILDCYPMADLDRPGVAFSWHTFLMALEAAAPHLTADPTTESEGFRAYSAGVAAGFAKGAATERDRACRIARHYLDGNVWREFADRVGGQP